jgi:RNA polymerase sigma factor (sigma-70 family)
LLPSSCVKFSDLQSAAQVLEALPERTDNFGAIYEENYRLLVGTAVDRYRIAEIDAESLAHEVFLAFFLKAGEIIDSRAWLMSAVCNAAKAFLRTRARLVPLSDELGEEADPRHVSASLPDQLVAREAFSCVSAVCQIALRLRYLEGYSIPEVATELNTSKKYATKLVRRCLRQAKYRYAKKGAADERD